jgi:D-beta-D-heptose 7-phosphate kinase/D-beta-D-heptose 1-phosphate adenosyltransferase
VTETTDQLINLLDRWQPRRIVVAGDFMLDRYAYGNAERLSPDAPVPVLAVERDGEVLTGIDAGLVIQEDDVLIVVGNDEAIDAFADIAQ